MDEKDKIVEATVSEPEKATGEAVEGKEKKANVLKYIVAWILIILIWALVAVFGALGLAGAGYGIYLIFKDTSIVFYVLGIGLAMCGVCALLVFAALSVQRWALGWARKK